MYPDDFAPSHRNWGVCRESLTNYCIDLSKTMEDFNLLCWVAQQIDDKKKKKLIDWLTACQRQPPHMTLPTSQCKATLFPCPTPLELVVVSSVINLTSILGLQFTNWDYTPGVKIQNSIQIWIAEITMRKPHWTHTSLLTWKTISPSVWVNYYITAKL